MIGAVVRGWAPSRKCELGEVAMGKKAKKMGLALRWWLSLAGAAVAVLWAPAAGAAELLGVRLGETSKDATRIVFDLSEKVDYAIVGDDTGNGRITIELKGISAAAQEKRGVGHILSYRVAAAGNGTTDVTFELSRTAKIAEKFDIPPGAGAKQHRLVIDLASADKAAFLASLPSRYEDLTAVIKAATAESTKPAAPVEAAADRPIIVIDAGHGGGDPGASSASGVQEKTITLAAAKRLAEILNARGRYRIVMTRADDTRLDLQERSRLAREAGAELFISLHADAHADSTLRGGSVYTVSEKGKARSAQTAEALGDHDAFDLNLKEFAPEVSEILFDKAQTFTENNSSKFAETLIRHLKDVTPLLNNSHRRDDLFVLLAPDVPAALLELAYISNEKDVANLTSPAWRTRTMTAVADAIDAYFDAQKGERHAFAQPAQR